MTISTFALIAFACVVAMIYIPWVLYLIAKMITVGVLRGKKEFHDQEKETQNGKAPERP